jgi:nucleoside-diphosphate-sugar epimerase
VPDDPYGASKRAVELIGEALRNRTTVQFVVLRIARVVGPGIRKTSSPGRSQIFEWPRQLTPIRIPYSPDATLSLVHVEDVARMLITLADAAATNTIFYNTPVEIWTAEQLKRVIEEVRGIPVKLEPGGSHGGPLCDVSLANWNDARLQRHVTLHRGKQQFARDRAQARGPCLSARPGTAFVAQQGRLPSRPCNEPSRPGRR